MRFRGAGPLCVLVATAAAAGAQDLPEIKRRGTLRVLAVVDEKEPEFVSLKPGGTPGFDREILEGFATTQGVRLELITVPNWQALMPWLGVGKGDLIAGRVSDTPARRTQAEFTREVFPTRIVVVNRLPRTPVATIAELAPLRLGTIMGTGTVDAMKAAGLPTQRIVPLAAGTLSESLREGRADAAVWALESALLAQRRDPHLQIGPFLGPPQSLAYGVRRDAPLLLRALNDHILTVRRTGTWNRLVVKYFGQTASAILARVKEP
jgi:ABC-type amino acid transport substrate-binding protein